MLFWIVAIAVTAIASAALYYASIFKPADAGLSSDALADNAMTAHYKKQLSEIETDIRNARLSEAEGIAAKGELAREVLRLKKEQSEAIPKSGSSDARLMPLAIMGVALLAFATYSFVGHPDLPSRPLAGRPEIVAQNVDLDDAMARIEAQLVKTPDDLRGWTVIAPVYMQTGRFADAVKARRRILELAPVTADTETDLAEALLMAANGDASGEPLALLKSAAARDPSHVRSRFYLAGEAMREGDFATAKTEWSALVAMAKPDDAWLPNAKAGLAAAEAQLNGTALPAEDDIRTMVTTLAARLEADGGSVEEWTRLVRSWIVLKDLVAAQAAYDKARLAYPAAFDRSDLDSLAAAAGLKLDGATP